ncbi:MAG: zinc ABC transporter substrate-binding protein, partial [Lautropia sp.]|nr:zinc ABC transporter substrate-binding protein [Lautropia sp.]
MKALFFALTVLCGYSAASPAFAVINVLTCEPEWAALVKEIAGDRARIFSATTAKQDPHRIEARPALLAQARRADLLVCTGAELEIGWLPLLQRESGNANIQEGRPGYFEAARFVQMLEKPATLNRAMGDVHAAG